MSEQTQWGAVLKAPSIGCLYRSEVDVTCGICRNTIPASEDYLLGIRSGFSLIADQMDDEMVDDLTEPVHVACIQAQRKESKS